jgi:hypothetical protein
MLPIVPKSETRFWSILLCIVMAIFTGFGEGSPQIDGQEIQGFAGVLVCLAAFPFITFFGAIGFSCALYFDRMRMRRQR